jgi:predicted outer membrane repeat protein
MKTRITSYFRSAAIAAVLLCLATVSAHADIITVTNTNDSGPGSLRQALSIVNDGDTIDFVVTGTITLTTGELPVNDSITISGPGTANLAVNGNHISRVFHIGPGETVIISDLTITANSGDEAGGIYSLGGGGQAGSATLHISDSTFSNNSSTLTAGAVYSNGSGSGTATLQISNSTFSSNSATNLNGGAIYNDGANGPLLLKSKTVPSAGTRPATPAEAFSMRVVLASR